MPKQGGGAAKKGAFPGSYAIKQIRQQGDYSQAVTVVRRALASPNTRPALAARSKAILSSKYGAEVSKRAMKLGPLPGEKKKRKK